MAELASKTSRTIPKLVFNRATNPLSEIRRHVFHRARPPLPGAHPDTGAPRARRDGVGPRAEVAARGRAVRPARAGRGGKGRPGDADAADAAADGEEERDGAAPRRHVIVGR